MRASSQRTTGLITCQAFHAIASLGSACRLVGRKPATRARFTTVVRISGGGGRSRSAAGRMRSAFSSSFSTLISTGENDSAAGAAGRSQLDAVLAITHLRPRLVLPARVLPAARPDEHDTLPHRRFQRAQVLPERGWMNCSKATVGNTRR